MGPDVEGPYLHVLDSVDALSFALTNREMKDGIYNVLGENPSMNRITSVILREVPDSRVIIPPTPNLNQVSYELDESKIERAGFKPHHTMEEGVREIVDKFRTLLKDRSPRDVAKLVSPTAALSEA